MRSRPVRQLPLRFGVETTDFPLEVLEEARRLLIELLLCAGRDESEPRGGSDEREDPTDAPRA